MPPVMIDMVTITAIVMMCGMMLGLIPVFTKDTDDNSNNKEVQIDSSSPVRAVDEKTRLQIEMDLLREMLQTRQEKLAVVKSDWDRGGWWDKKLLDVMAKCFQGTQL